MTPRAAMGQGRGGPRETIALYPLLRPPARPPAPETVAALMVRLTGVDITRCPVCQQGRLRVVARLPPAPLAVPGWDTS